MKPWEYQRVLRDNSEWMLNTWIEKYGRRNTFGWISWVLTEGNPDESVPTKLSKKDANRIFDDLENRCLLERRLVQTENGNGFAWFIVDEPSWNRLVKDCSFWSLTFKPFLFWLRDRPFTTLVLAIIAFIFSSFFGTIVSNWADDIYDSLSNGLEADNHLRRDNTEGYSPNPKRKNTTAP